MEQECYKLYWTNPGSNIPQNTSCMATYLLSLKLSKLDEQDMWDTAGEVRTNLWATFSYGPPNIGKKLELIYNSSVRTWDVV